MTIKTLYRAVVFGVLTLLMSGRVLASPTIAGYWLKETEDPLKSAIIEIYPDDGGFDGRVLKLKHPAFVEGETSVTGDVVPEALVGQIKTDVLNPVEVLRKRPIDPDRVERAVSGIVRQLESSGEQEIPAEDIGTLVMEALKGMDDVAYVRFASVYKNFQEADDFEEFVAELRPVAKGEEP